MSYLDVAHDVYKVAAEMPDVGLCCTTSPIWKLPALDIPKKMLEMNYGCGTTVHPRDLADSPTVVYIGVGGGMEVLQFSYFSRRSAAVIGVDIVDEMLEACDENLKAAVASNPWFERDYVSLRKGNALSLPIENASVDVAAQNCLFNIFEAGDLQVALREAYRILKPHGRLILSDPICEQTMPETLASDQRLRALCLSGAIPLKKYINVLAEVGFGTIEIRAKRPYRVLSRPEYDVADPIIIQSVEVAAIKDPVPPDGVCVFSGKSGIYYGTQLHFDDQKGHVLLKNQPLAICDKTADALSSLRRPDIYISDSTYFYDGGGCC